MTREFLDYVLPWLVDNPEEARIEEVEGERGETVLELSLHPDDMGKIIGKRGRIIRSLRQLVRVGGHRDGRSMTVEVVD